MRLKAFLSLVVVIYTAVAFGQVSTENYVIVYKAQKPLTGDLSQISDKKKVIKTIVYYDGLGREIQTVAKGQSPAGYDIVSVSAYDGFSRKTSTFLPFVSGDTTGASKNNAISAQAAFYTSMYDSIDGKFAFAFQRLETSELGRVLEQTAPGNAWKIGSNHTVTTSYGTNTISSVLKLQFDPTAGIYITPGADTYFQTSELLMKVVFDEQKNEVLEFTDKEGRVVCKKVKAATNVYAETYYVYDRDGNLVVVVQPEGVKDIRAMLQGQ